MIRFEYIEWMNFLSTGNQPIRVQLNTNPMSLIVGVNGAGKSTMLDALCYNLFGKAYRSINLPQLVNSINMANCVTTSEFRIGPKQFKVVRGLKPSLFEIYENGKLLEQEAAKKDYQRILERDILGMSVEAFRQIVVIGSDAIPFMRLDASDRRGIIENLLDIGVFSTMNGILKDRVRLTEDEMDGLRMSIQTTLEKINIQKKHIAAGKQNTQQVVDAKTADMEKLDRQAGILNQSIKQLDGEYASLTDQLVDLAKVQEKIKKADGYRIALTSNRERWAKNLEFFKDNNQCTTCRQELKNKEYMIDGSQREIYQLDQALAELDTVAKGYQTRLTELNQVAQLAEQAKLKRTKQFAEYKSLTAQSGNLQLEIEALKNAPVSESIMEVSRELLADLQTLNGKKAELHKLTQRQDIASALLRDGGIKAQIIQNYLPVINQTINKYLNDLDFFVDFNIDNEFKETIKSRHRDLFSYENFSAGQKTRIDLSLLFTWRAISKLKNSVDCNILILDEVLDGSLDSDGLEEFVKLLDIFCQNANAFVISHRGDVLADKFSHVLKFELTGNFTEMSEE